MIFKISFFLNSKFSSFFQFYCTIFSSVSHLKLVNSPMTFLRTKLFFYCCQIIPKLNEIKLSLNPRKDRWINRMTMKIIYGRNKNKIHSKNCKNLIQSLLNSLNWNLFNLIVNSLISQMSLAHTIKEVFHIQQEWNRSYKSPFTRIVIEKFMSA